MVGKIRSGGKRKNAASFSNFSPQTESTKKDEIERRPLSSEQEKENSELSSIDKVSLKTRQLEGAASHCSIFSLSLSSFLLVQTSTLFKPSALSKVPGRKYRPGKSAQKKWKWIDSTAEQRERGDREGRKSGSCSWNKALSFLHGTYWPRDFYY